MKLTFGKKHWAFSNLRFETWKTQVLKPNPNSTLLSLSNCDKPFRKTKTKNQQLLRNKFKGSIHIWRQIFLGIFDLPTYPHQILYYISLFSKIRWGLTYLPTQKSVIYECSQSWNWNMKWISGLKPIYR